MKSRQTRQSARMAVNVDHQPNADHIMVRNVKHSLTDGYKEAGDAHAFNRRFFKILEAIRKSMKDDLSLTDTDYDIYMKELRDVGGEAYASLPDEMGDYISELDDDTGERGISLDFTFDPKMDMLWEMIYTGDIYADVEPEKFWGFRYPIAHRFWDWDVRENVRLRKGIFASAHEELTHSVRELELLGQSLADLKTRLNRDLSILRVEEALEDDPPGGDKLLAYFNDESFNFGVVHFACHCDSADVEDAAQAQLQFTARQTNLSLYLGRLRASAKKGFRGRPLVFLNACESQTRLKFLQSLSFPSGLAKFGAGGVIATACTMPDQFASAYAAEFYRRLLDKPSNQEPAFIGETMLETSLHFLYERKNPLGLAYGLYAVSNQQLQLD